MNPLSQEVIDKYKKLNWTFTSTSWNHPDGKIILQWYYKSPRMKQSSIINDGFVEENLTVFERRYYIWQAYGPNIYAAFEKSKSLLIDQLVLLQKLKDNGKPVDIPPEIIVKEIAVNLLINNPPS